MTDVLEIMAKAEPKYWWSVRHLGPINGFELVRCLFADEDGNDPEIVESFPPSNENWRKANDLADQRNRREAMRAALLALAEAELPDRLHGTQDNGEEYVIHANVESTRWLFRSICRSLAEGE